MTISHAIFVILETEFRNRERFPKIHEVDDGSIGSERLDRDHQRKS